LRINLQFYLDLARNTNFWVISLSHLFTHVFDLMNLALIPVFIEEFSITLVQAGFLVTLPLLASMVSSILSGIIMSKFSYKPLMILSLSMMGFSALLVSVTPNFLMLMLYLSLLTFASRLYCPAALSIVSESCEDCELNRGKNRRFPRFCRYAGNSFRTYLFWVSSYFTSLGDYHISFWLYHCFCRQFPSQG
jgi:MFS family permease